MAPKRILDLCTGSGCIAAWAAHAFPETAVIATDLSEEALAIAEENCKAHESFSGQVNLLQGDLFEALPAEVEPFDVIVSNPPYIPSATVETLESEVKDHEPRLALDGGPEGMDIVSRIIEEAPARLIPGGLLLMEIDDTQKESVLACCRSSGQSKIFKSNDEARGVTRGEEARPELRRRDEKGCPAAGPRTHVKPSKKCLQPDFTCAILIRLVKRMSAFRSASQ